MPEDHLPNIAMLALLQWARECAGPADRTALRTMLLAAADWSPNTQAQHELNGHAALLALEDTAS